MRASRIAIAMAFVICAVATGPALADHDDHHHGRSEHEWHRGWHERPFFYSSAPDVYYAPPPVVYTPAYPSPGINLVFPLWIH